MKFMNNCILCDKTGYLICSKCALNPFRVEDCRKILANSGRIDDLLKLYSPKYKEIVDNNTPDLWNTRFSEFESLDKQDGMTKDRIKTIYHLIKNKQGNLLDIGVGQGYLEELYANKSKLNIFAIDISDTVIKRLSKKYKGQFKKQSVYDMNFNNNYFDVIVILEVLEHIPPSKIFNVLKHINKLLKRGGLLIVSVPTNEGLENMSINYNAHTRDYSENLIISELHISGFNICNVKRLYSFKNYYKIKKLLVRIIKHRWHPNNIIIVATKP